MIVEWVTGCVLLTICAGMRLYLAMRDYLRNRRRRHQIENSVSMSQTTGGQECQSDVMEVYQTQAGRLAVLADGIGKENTGKVSARIAVQVFEQLYCQYRILKNPVYLLKRAFAGANLAIQRIIGERRGGASIAAAYMDGEFLHYALAGDIRIALFRNGELLPLSEGHTIRTLVKKAWDEGKITRQETLRAIKSERIWNYVGMDGFREIETVDKPIRLKKKDVVLLMTKGIYQELPWIEIEEIMKQTGSTSRTKADQIVKAAEAVPVSDQENGSVIIMEAWE